MGLLKKYTINWPLCEKYNESITKLTNYKTLKTSVLTVFNIKKLRINSELFK